MSVDIYAPEGFDVDVTLVNGRMQFGFSKKSEVDRFLAWVVEHPEAEVSTDHGPRSCASLAKYIEEGRVAGPLTRADFYTATAGDPRWRR